MKIVPIKPLIKKIEKLSTDQYSNKEELKFYSNKVKKQKDAISNVSMNKIKDRLDNDDLTISECKKYKDLLKEKKNYDKYEYIINDIINKDYDSIYIRRRKRRIKEAALLSAGSALLILGSVYMLKGNNKQKEEITTEIVLEDTREDYNYTTESTTKATTQTTTITTTETTTEKEEEIEFDDDIIDYSKFDSIKEYYDDANEYIDIMEDTLSDEDKREEAKKNAKKTVVKYIDFIFYGTEINGVTFDELKDDEKKKVYEQLQKLNKVISEQDPDYLDNLGERYQRLKDLGSLTLEKAKEKIKEKIGEDYYDDIGDVKDDTVDTIKDTGNIIKKYIKTKYEEWREDN